MTVLPDALFLKRLEPGFTLLATSDDIHDDIGSSMSFATL